jgi:hypothetical protein
MTRWISASVSGRAAGWAHLLGVLNGVTTNGVRVGGHHRQSCEVAAVCTAKKGLQNDEEG